MDDDGGSDDAEAKDVLAMGGASARAISLKKMVCWMSVVPRPPYCLGQETPAQPPSKSLRCQARKKAKRSSMDLSPFCFCQPFEGEIRSPANFCRNGAYHPTGDPRGSWNWWKANAELATTHRGLTAGFGLNRVASGRDIRQR